jgi:hypothetical protein
VGELAVRDGSLVGAQQPALERRRDAVDMRHDDVDGIARLLER